MMFMDYRRCPVIWLLSFAHVRASHCVALPFPPRLVGLLKVGVPQPWETSKKNLNYVRQAGVRQFISTYNRVKDLKGDELLWGDEIEYGIFVLDDKDKKIRLSLRAKEVSVLLELSRHIERDEHH